MEISIENSCCNPKLDSIKFLLKAQCNEANENKANAKKCYFECLKLDPNCVEAFTRLIDCYLLSNPES